MLFYQNLCFFDKLAEIKKGFYLYILFYHTKKFPINYLCYLKPDFYFGFIQTLIIYFGKPKFNIVFGMKIGFKLVKWL